MSFPKAHCCPLYTAADGLARIHIQTRHLRQPKTKPLYMILSSPAAANELWGKHGSLKTRGSCQSRASNKAPHSGPQHRDDDSRRRGNDVISADARPGRRLGRVFRSPIALHISQVWVSDHRVHRTPLVRENWPAMPTASACKCQASPWVPVMPARASYPG